MLVQKTDKHLLGTDPAGLFDHFLGMGAIIQGSEEKNIIEGSVFKRKVIGLGQMELGPMADSGPGLMHICG